MSSSSTLRLVEAPVQLDKRCLVYCGPEHCNCRAGSGMGGVVPDYFEIFSKDRRVSLIGPRGQELRAANLRAVLADKVSEFDLLENIRLRRGRTVVFDVCQREGALAQTFWLAGSVPTQDLPMVGPVRYRIRVRADSESLHGYRT